MTVANIRIPVLRDWQPGHGTGHKEQADQDSQADDEEEAAVQAGPFDLCIQVTDTVTLTSGEKKLVSLTWKHSCLPLSLFLSPWGPQTVAAGKVMLARQAATEAVSLEREGRTEVGCGTRLASHACSSLGRVL